MSASFQSVVLILGCTWESFSMPRSHPNQWDQTSASGSQVSQLIPMCSQFWETLVQATFSRIFSFRQEEKNLYVVHFLFSLFLKVVFIWKRERVHRVGRGKGGGRENPNRLCTEHRAQRETQPHYPVIRPELKPRVRGSTDCATQAFPYSFWLKTFIFSQIKLRSPKWWKDQNQFVFSSALVHPSVKHS